ncbi:MAG: hypothetical protein JWN95_2789 [Frankiales bacterium]|nr:hypothetical protein [Frankiales bacterium]
MSSSVKVSGIRWAVLLAAIVIGSVCYALFADEGARAGLSYAGGLLLVAGAFEFGAFNIRLAGRVAPQLTLSAAVFSYLVTVVGLALVLIASSPRVVVGWAVAVGIFVAMTIWLGGELWASRVPRVATEQPQVPVNIRRQDESVSRSTRSKP